MHALTQSSGAVEKVDEITDFLSSSLEAACNCSYSPKYLALGSLQCGDQSTDRTVLYGTLVSSENTASTQMLDHLQTLVYTEPTVLVQGVQLRVASCSVLPDKSCPILIPLPAVTVAIGNGGGGGGISFSLIGGVAGGLLLLICGAVLLILIVVGAKRRVKRKERVARYALCGRFV